MVATSNIPWTVKIHAIGPDMGISDDVGAHTLIIDYKVLTGQESYKKGDYGLTLVYTITSD